MPSFTDRYPFVVSDQQRYATTRPMPWRAVEVGAHVFVPVWRSGAVVAWVNAYVREVRYGRNDVASVVVTYVDPTIPDAVHQPHSLMCVACMGEGSCVHCRP
jgi:hypothetical protein